MLKTVLDIIEHYKGVEGDDTAGSDAIPGTSQAETEGQAMGDDVL